MTARVRNLVVAALVLVAGVVGLLLPVSVFDGGTSTVGCGNAVIADLPAPGPVADGHPDYAAACESAISGRRHWAIPLVIVGVAGMAVGFIARGRGRPATGVHPDRAPG